MSSIMILLALVGGAMLSMQAAINGTVWAARWAYFAARFSRLRWAP